MGYSSYYGLYDSMIRRLDTLLSITNTVIPIIFLISIVVSIFAIRSFISIWRSKGHTDSSFGLWIIGLVLPLGVIVVALYVIASPDKNNKGMNRTPIKSELPPL